MISNQSAVNIAIRVTAQKAIATIQRLEQSLSKVTIRAEAAGGVLDALAGASRGYTAALGGTSKAAADLAKALSLINKVGGRAATHLVNIGAGAELAAPALTALAAAAVRIEAVMKPLSAQFAITAASMKTMATVAGQTAVASARADAVRTAASTKAANAVEMNNARVDAVNAKTAAATQLAATKIAEANTKAAAATEIASAKVGAAKAAETAANERAAAAAATSAASQAAAAARLARINQGQGPDPATLSWFDRLNERVDTSSEKMRKFGSQMQWTGRQLSMSFTLPLAALGTAAIVWGMQQEEAWTMVKKVYGDGSAAALAESEKVRKGLDMLSDYFGKNREEIYETAEAYASLGLTGGNLAQAVKTTAEVSMLGNMDMTKSTEALIAIQSQYQFSTRETLQAMQELNAIANQGPLEMDGLVEAMSRVGAGAKASGLSIAEVAGLLEALAPATGTATMAGNGLKSILASIANPSKDAAGALDALGINTARWSAEGVTMVDRLKEMGVQYDKLAPAQKIAFDQLVAGRYQLVRFGQVLTDINNPAGEFASALAAVGQNADGSSRSLKVWEQELAIIMESDPQKFKQMWQVIKNSIVDAFKPLVPTVIQFVTLIARMAKWFSELSPTTRQWIMVIGLALAVIGPIVIVLASLVLLLGVLGPAFMTAAGGAAAFGKALIWLTTAGKLGTMPVLIARVIKMLTLLSRGFQLAIAAGIVAFSKGFALLGPAVAAGSRAAVAAVSRFLVMPIITAVGSALTAIAAVVGLPVWAVVAAIAAIGATLYALWHWRDQVVAIVKNVAGPFMALPRVVLNAMRGVIEVLVRAARTIKSALSALNPFQRHSPSLVDNVKAGTAIISDEYAGLAASVQDSMSRANAAVQDFSATSARLNLNAQEVEYQDKRARVAQVDPGAAAGMDRLRGTQRELEAQVTQVTAAIEHQQGVIDSWQATIDAADRQIKSMNETLDAMQAAADMTSKMIDAAQERLSRFENAQIKGSGAMSDAIFENEMAQKRLRLEIMRLEDAGQTVDDVADKFAKLQGEIENLQAKREDLRLGGAGSDILGHYDQMIEDLRAQQGASATGQVSEITKAQNALEELERRGQRLDLENSLQFDGLNRQLEKMKSNVEEMPFEQIVAGIAGERAAIAGLTAAHDIQTQAIDIQKAAIDSATKSRDRMQESMGAEQDKLDGLNKLQSDLQESLDAVNRAMDVTVQSADTMIAKWEEEQQALEDQQKALEDQADALDKAGDAAAGAEDKFGSLLDGFGDENMADLLPNTDDIDFDQWAADLEQQMSDAFGEMDLFAPVKEAWNGFTGWLGRIPENIGGFFSGMASSVGGWFVGIGAAIGGWFAGLWPDSISPALSNIPGGFSGWIMNLPGAIASALSYLAGWLTGQMVQIVGTAFAFGSQVHDYFFGGGFAADVGDIMTPLGNWVGGIGMAVADFFRETVPQWGRNVGIYFANGQFSQDVAAAGQAVIDWAGDMLGAVGRFFTQTIPAWGRAVYDYFVGDGFYNDVIGAKDRLVEIGQDVIWGFFGGIVSVVQNIGTLVNDHLVQPFIQGVKDNLGINSPSTVFIELGKNVVQGLIDGIGSMGSALIDYVKNFFQRNVTDKVKDILHIGSPSKVFAELGMWVGAGFAQGMESSSDRVTAAAQAMADAATDVELSRPTTQVSGADVVGQVQAITNQTTATLVAGNAVQGQQLGVLEAAWASAYQGIHDRTLLLAGDQASRQIQISAAAQGALNSSQAVFSTAQIAGQQGLRDNIVKITDSMQSGVVSVVDRMTRSTAQLMSNNRDQAAQLSMDTKDQVVANMQSMSDGIASVFANGVQPVFDSFGPMLQTTQDNFSSTVDNIGSIWANIQGKTADPAKFVINEVYNNGIRQAWNKVNGWLSLPALEEYVAPFAAGGAVKPISDTINSSNPRSIIRGGKLSGPSHGDKTLFAGNGGEYVLTKAMATDVGYGRLEAWRHAANSGKSVEGAASTLGPIAAFAGGGEVRPGVIDDVFTKLAPFKGRTYQYGGGGNPGYDCSGWTGAVHKVLLGGSPLGRIWTTESNFSSFGYKRGREGWWSMGVHNGGGGMMSHTAGTLDGINFEAGGGHNTSTWGGPAAGTINSQFENQYYLPELGGVFKGTAGGGGSGPSMLQRVEEAYRSVMDPLKERIPAREQGGLIGDLPKQGYDKFDKDVWAYLSQKASEYDAANAAVGNIAYDISAGVEQWRGTVHQALDMVGQSRALDEITLRRMQQESSGNPNAINLTDSNAAAGTPSKGLMQVIDPTFQAYKYPGYDNIWDPLSNILASMRYALARYGSLQAAYGRAGGYDGGGWLPDNGMGYNTSGVPEAVLTGPQWGDVHGILTALTTMNEGRGYARTGEATSILTTAVTNGFLAAFTGPGGNDVASTLTGSSLDALDGWAQTWDPLFYDATKAASAQVAVQTSAVAAATNDVANGVKGVTKSVTGVASAVQSFTAVGEDISKSVKAMVVLAQVALAAGQGQEVDWAAVGAAVGSLLEVGASLLEKIPDQEPTYWAEVDTAGLSAEEKAKLKREVENQNLLKGIVQFTKDVGPVILRSLAPIAAAVGGIATMMIPLVVAAGAMAATGNIIGAALILIPGILTAILTLIPLIIDAIMQIVPALIMAIVRFVTQFIPGAERAYENYEAAAKVVSDAQSKRDADAARQARAEEQARANTQVSGGDTVVVNIYGDISLPNVTNSSSAEDLIDDVNRVAGN